MFGNELRGVHALGWRERVDKGIAEERPEVHKKGRAECRSERRMIMDRAWTEYGATGAEEATIRTTLTSDPGPPPRSTSERQCPGADLAKKRPRSDRQALPNTAPHLGQEAAAPQAVGERQGGDQDPRLGPEVGLHPTLEARARRHQAPHLLRAAAEGRAGVQRGEAARVASGKGGTTLQRQVGSINLKSEGEEGVQHTTSNLMRPHNAGLWANIGSRYQRTCLRRIKQRPGSLVQYRALRGRSVGRTSGHVSRPFFGLYSNPGADREHAPTCDPSTKHQLRARVSSSPPCHRRPLSPSHRRRCSP